MKVATFTSLALTILILISATILEKVYGTAFVYENIYSSWWFVGVWVVLCLCSIVYIIQRKLYKRIITLCLHLSFILILAGALITHIYGEQGRIHLRRGIPSCTYILSGEEHITAQLPFMLTLQEFEVMNYPGTASPMDYRSVIKVHGETEGLMSISMNNIGEYDYYRFYQSGYDTDGEGTILSISHDPWGIGVTYSGYGLLFVSMLLFLILPNESFRHMLRQIASRGTTLAVCLLLATTYASASGHDQIPPTVPRDVANHFGNLYTYYNGRICPVQTVARDFATKIHGSASYKGLSAEQILLGWTLYPTSWIEEPFIKVKGDAVGNIIGKEDKHLRYSDFFHNSQYLLEAPLTEIREGHDIDGARSIEEADEKMNILLMLFGGQMLKIYPYMSTADSTGSMSGVLTWYSQGDNLPMEMDKEKWLFAKKSLDYVGELAATHQYDKLDEVIDKIRKYQRQEGASLLPSDSVFEAERLYNAVANSKVLAMILLTIGIISFIVCTNCWIKGKRLHKAVAVSMVTVMALSATYLLGIICLRSYVSGHLPLSNGYETMQFMSLCCLSITLMFWKRFQLLPPFGYILAGLSLLVAMMGESNPPITPLMPVLSSPLLSIHVCIIMVAYSLLAFTMLSAATSLILMAMGRGKHETHIHQLAIISRVMLYPALFCLAAGIFIGAIWANVSWGRYWGWDPKEVWALITMLIYAIAVHKGSMKWLANDRAFHIYMLLAFLSVIITYFGVNFFLGGMHSYANS